MCSEFIYRSICVCKHTHIHIISSIHQLTHSDSVYRASTVFPTSSEAQGSGVKRKRVSHSCSPLRVQILPGEGSLCHITLWMLSFAGAGWWRCEPTILGASWGGEVWAESWGLGWVVGGEEEHGRWRKWKDTCVKAHRALENPGIFRFRQREKPRWQHRCCCCCLWKTENEILPSLSSRLYSQCRGLRFNPW